MLTAYLVRMVEQHAGELTKELVDDLLTNERTPTFRRLSRDELEQPAHDIYHNLGEWLAGHKDDELDPLFIGLGRQRFHQKVPLPELVCAIILTKRHLRDRIRSVSTVHSAVELHNEIQLSMMIGRFFDRMLYGAVKGYEEAREEQAHPPKPSTPSKLTLEKTPTHIDWVP